MNIHYYRLIIFALAVACLTLGSCTDPCASATNDAVGEEFFTVRYEQNGTNLFELMNPAGIVVFVDTTGGESPNPKFELITPGFDESVANSEKTFGPFKFTERFLNLTSNEINLPLLFQRDLRYDYYIKKDTYGQDTLTVSFLLGVDECSYNWTYIEYFLNGDPLPQYNGQRQPEILIQE